MSIESFRYHAWWMGIYLRAYGIHWKGAALEEVTSHRRMAINAVRRMERKLGRPPRPRPKGVWPIVALCAKHVPSIDGRQETS